MLEYISLPTISIVVCYISFSCVLVFSKLNFVQGLKVSDAIKTSIQILNSDEMEMEAASMKWGLDSYEDPVSQKVKIVEVPSESSLAVTPNKQRGYNTE